MARARPVAGLHPRATLLENARAIVAMRVAEMFDFVHAVGDPDEDEDLHNMRIAAKRLRYTLEMFQVCLGPDGADLIETVKEIQERIGSIHDADVLAQLVRLRLAVVAHRGAESLGNAAVTVSPAGDTADAASGDEDARVAAVRAVAHGDDPRLGLAVLLARTAARREREFAAFTAWWEEHGGDALRARLDAGLLDKA